MKKFSGPLKGHFLFFLTCFISFQSLAIINGVRVSSGQSPSVVFLFNRATSEVCTGTFISPTKVLTAAHCLAYFDEDEGNWKESNIEIVEVKDRANSKLKVLANSEKVFWARGAPRRNFNNGSDLGIVIFPPARGRIYSSIMLFRPPSILLAEPRLENSDHPQFLNRIRVGDKVNLIGWGSNSMINNPDIITQRSGIKRKGWNYISGVSKKGFLYLETPTHEVENQNYASGYKAMGSFGDSGSALFIDDKIVAVWSRTADGAKVIDGIAIFLGSPSSQKFIKSLDLTK